MSYPTLPPPFHPDPFLPAVIPQQQLPPYQSTSDEMQKQLDEMKAAMEAMRLEKLKLEAENLRRAQEAEEERKRKEEERLREIAEKEQKELKMIHAQVAEKYEKQMQEVGRGQGDNWIQEYTNIVKRMQMKGEIILHLDMEWNGGLNRVCINGILTNKNVYRGLYIAGGQLIPNIYTPVYTFDQPLTLHQTKMLLVTPVIKIPKTEYKIWNTQTLASYMTFNSCSDHNKDLRRKFESVVRLIPGSYKNGDWKQLDEFFGMYYNQITGELSEFPPCDE